MKEQLENKIEDWLENLGYSFDYKLYSRVSKMSYKQPSYKIMAETVLNSIKNNPKLDEYEAWRYTTNFVNGMKTNLIANNIYFQSVFKNGLFNPVTKEQENKINLFNIRNNEYNFLKNIWLSNDNCKKNFDFIMIVNGFPLVLIKIVDGNKKISFEEIFLNIEDDFDEFPMFFNFNKLILFTDGVTFKMGTLYNLPEEYIEFCDDKKEKYSIEQLEYLLSSENIVPFLKKTKNADQISKYIDQKLIEKANNNIKKNTRKTIVVKDIVDEKNNIEKKENIKSNVSLYEDEEFDYLLCPFSDNLEDVLKSQSFQKRLRGSMEVPDYKENKNYIEDIRKNNNMDTLDTFIKANERLVFKEVNKYRIYETSSMDFDDMYQFGFMGLMKAFERFDLSRGNEFSTYALHWIKQSIIRGINYESLLIRIPVYRWDSLIELRKLELKSEIKFKKVDYNWISRELNLSQEKILELIKIRDSFMNNVSLDVPVGVDGDTVLGEFIEDKNNNVEEIILNKDLRDNLYEALDALDERSKDVIIKRFGLDGQKPMTLEEVGQMHNVTRERIRQIESKALDKLRHPSRSKKYKIYCED